MKKNIKSSIDSNWKSYQAVAQANIQSLEDLKIISYTRFNSSTRLHVGDNILVNNKIARIGTVFVDEVYGHRYTIAYPEMSLGIEEVIFTIEWIEDVSIFPEDNNLTGFTLEQVDTNELVIDVDGDITSLKLTPYKTLVTPNDIVDDIDNIFQSEFKGTDIVDVEGTENGTITEVGTITPNDGISKFTEYQLVGTNIYASGAISVKGIRIIEYGSGNSQLFGLQTLNNDIISVNTTLITCPGSSLTNSNILNLDGNWYDQADDSYLGILYDVITEINEIKVRFYLNEDRNWAVENFSIEISMDTTDGHDGTWTSTLNGVSPAGDGTPTISYDLIDTKTTGTISVNGVEQVIETQTEGVGIKKLVFTNIQGASYQGFQDLKLFSDGNSLDLGTPTVNTLTQCTTEIVDIVATSSWNDGSHHYACNATFDLNSNYSDAGWIFGTNTNNEDENITFTFVEEQNITSLSLLPSYDSISCDILIYDSEDNLIQTINYSISAEATEVSVNGELSTTTYTSQIVDTNTLEITTDGSFNSLDYSTTISTPTEIVTDITKTITQEIDEPIWTKYQLVAKELEGTITVNGIEQVVESEITNKGVMHIGGTIARFTAKKIDGSNFTRDELIATGAITRNDSSGWGQDAYKNGLFQTSIPTNYTDYSYAAGDLDIDLDLSLIAFSEFTISTHFPHSTHVYGCTVTIDNIVSDLENPTDGAIPNFVTFTKEHIKFVITTFTEQLVDTNTLELAVSGTVERIDTKTYINEDVITTIQDTDSITYLTLGDFPYTLTQQIDQTNFNNYLVTTVGLEEGASVTVNGEVQTIEFDIEGVASLETTNDLYDIVRVFDYNAVASEEILEGFNFKSSSSFSTADNINIGTKLLLDNINYAEIKTVENNIEEEEINGLLYGIEHQDYSRTVSESGAVSHTFTEAVGPVYNDKPKIKKITISNMIKYGSYMAFGGVEFFNDTNKFDIGTTIIDTKTTCETSTILGEATSTWNNGSLYHVIYPISVEDTTSTSYSYWLAGTADNTQTITYTFKEIQELSKLTIVPSISSDRGITQATITYYDENNEIIDSHLFINPNTTNYNTKYDINIDHINSNPTSMKSFELPTLSVSYYNIDEEVTVGPIEKSFDTINISEDKITFDYNDETKANTNKIEFEPTGINEIIISTKKIQGEI